MNERMKDYLRREVSTGLEMMFRDNAAAHLFDVDKQGQYVFFMALVPKEAVSKIEPFMKIAQSLRPGTPGQDETV